MLEELPPSMTNIPLEVFDQIIDELSGLDLANLSVTCKFLHNLINGDRVWKRHCQWELDLYNYSPYNGFEQCFKCLYRHKWFKPNIWFGDKDPFGTLAISTYNEKSGYFEFYEVRSSMAQVEITGGEAPDDQFSVVSRLMNGRLSGTDGLSEDTASSDVSTTSASDTPNSPTPSSSLSRPSTPRIKSTMAHHISYSEPLVKINDQTDYDDERTLINFSQPRGLFRCLMRAPALVPERIHPSMSIWPPSKIPSKDRTRNISSSEFRGHLSKSSTPSADLLRIRTWLNYSSGPIGVMMGETVETYSKLSIDLLNPSPTLPWKGLWIYRSEFMGEFLLFHQSNPQSLEAIKLTGDNKVPRGEIAFFLIDLANPVPEGLKFVPDFIIKKNKPVFDAKYQTADLNYTNPSFNNAQVVFYDSDAILVYDENGSYIGDCCRVDHRLLIEGRLSHVAYP